MAHARATGAWSGVEIEIREGIACLRAAGGDRPTPDEVNDAATAFRQARSLVAAEEMEAWLERWDLTVGDWMDYIRRSVLLQASAGHPGPLAADLSIEADEVGSLEWPTAVCSGALERAAQGLAELLSVQERLAEAGVSVSLDAARHELARRVVNDEALQRQVRVRALDWIRIDSEELSLPGEDAAREALVLLRREGLSGTEVAETAHARITRSVRFLEDVESELRPSLVGAAKGDILGPFAVDGAWQVVVVRDKIPPAIDDLEVRRRAEDAIVVHAVRRELDERVVWHGGP